MTRAEARPLIQQLQLTQFPQKCQGGPFLQVPWVGYGKSLQVPGLPKAQKNGVVLPLPLALPGPTFCENGALPPRRKPGATVGIRGTPLIEVDCLGLFEIGDPRDGFNFHRDPLETPPLPSLTKSNPPHKRLLLSCTARIK